jgi:hypothetical protein
LTGDNCKIEIVKIKTHATIKVWFFMQSQEEFLIWSGTTSREACFFADRCLKDRAYEESASIEIYPVVQGAIVGLSWRIPQKLAQNCF